MKCGQSKSAANYSCKLKTLHDQNRQLCCVATI